MFRILLLPAILFGLAACETVQGFGQDVETTGDAISDTSRDVQADL